MRAPRATIRDFGVLGIVLALVVGIVVAAVQAEGPRTVRADINDGGAWLVNHSEGAIGHIERSTGEISEAVVVGNRGDRIDTEQSGLTVAVINASTDQLVLVDARTARSRNEFAVVPGMHIALHDEQALMWTADPLQVWSTSLADLGQAQTLDDIEMIIESTGPGMVEVTRFGELIVVDTGGALLYRQLAESDELTAVDLGAVGADVVGLGASGDDALLLTRSGALFQMAPEATDLGDPVALGSVTALAQPSLPDEPIVALTEDGTIFSVEPHGDERVAMTLGTLAGTEPLRPIVYRNCVFAVTTRPAELTRLCIDGSTETTPLEGATSDALRLRLVNNDIWVNDLRTGVMWVINEKDALDRIDDWGAALPNDDGTGEETEDVEGGEIEQRENPDADDADLIRADEIDEDDENDPPVARNDTVSTRVDTPVIVDVLSNDEDPDGDVLLIDSVSAGPAGATITATGGRQTVQVLPPAGSTEEFSFDYSISDGRGGTAGATVTVTPLDPTTNENRPPIAVTDATTARAGSSAALNVLTNDTDPDGDPIVLTAVTAASGSVIFDGGGQITFVPDPGSPEGTISLSYTIADTFGLTATGKVLVAIRLRESNTAPDARSDSAVAVAGRPVSLNVLLNDTDPDGDSISVAGTPTPVDPQQAEAEIDLSPDGQLFFVTDQPGQYLYRYTIIDAQQQDTAQIRIEVRPAEENRPPVAVRDDLTIPRGGSGVAYVLTNDFDPDGDVVSIDNWESAEFLDVGLFRGVGLIVEVDPAAPPQLSFRYTITDGLNEPTTGTVVVAVADSNGTNQPPVVRRDVVEVRPGRTAAANVLLNDFDPEGGPLRVDRVTDVADAELRIGADGQNVLVTLGENAISGFSFAYEVVDDRGNRSPGFVDVRIVPLDTPNRPPTALTDVARTRAGVGVSIPVLANDSDPDGDIVRVESIAAQPTSGRASLNEDGTITYVPERRFQGTDRFQYVAVDPLGGRDIAEVLVGVIPDAGENRPPTARDDSVKVIVGSDPFDIAVLDNDSDPDSDPLTITRASGGDEVAVIDSATALEFTPPVTIVGESTEVNVAYSISDGRGGTDGAIVTIEIVRSLDPLPPQPQDDVAGPIRTGDTVTVDVLANDTDPDGVTADLVVSSVDRAGRPGPTSGTLTFTAGPDTTTHPYTVTDPQGLTEQAFVTILVAQNLPPIVTLAPLTVAYETPVQLDLGLSVDDPDGDILFFACCQNARGGRPSVTASSGGSLQVTFTPDTSFSGSAGFSFNVDDQQGHVVSGVAQITVLPKANQAPTALPSTFEIEAGTNGTISLAPLTDDVDLATGDVLTYTISGATLPGVSMTGSSAARAVVDVATAIGDAGRTGSFTYTVSDSSGESASAPIQIVVTESRLPAPIAQPDRANTTQGVAVDIAVLGNDVDFSGGGLTLVDAGSASGAVGSITANVANGSVTYDPGAFFGTANLTYRIRDARNRPGGEATGTIAVDVIGVPSAPSTPVAEADNRTATVTWSQPTANGGVIDQLEIEPSTGAVRTLSPSSSTSFSGLTNGTPITFRVRAHNQAGWGDWSLPSAPVTPDTQPGRPGAPTVVFGDEELTVSWSEPPNEGSPVLSYTLEIGGGAQAVPRADIGATTYRWQNLVNGTSYRFRVTAVNAAGNSDASPWSTPEHPLREPDAVTSIQVSQGNRFLDLAWAAPFDNGDPISQYRVEMESQPGVFRSTTTRNYQWSDLTNGVQQRFRVQAKNRDADWSLPGPWSVALQPCGPPLAGPAMGATRADGQVALTWAAPNTNGCPIESYTIEAVGTALSRSAAAGATSLTFPGLTNGTAYTFRFLATNQMGTGEWSPPSAAVTPAGPPFALSDLSVAPLGQPGQVELSWTRPNANGSPITDYELSINGGGWTSVGTGGAGSRASAVRSGLAQNTTYTFQVRACNAVGCSPAPISVPTRTYGPPSTPSGFQSSASDYRASWSWNGFSPAEQNGPGFYFNFELNNGFGTNPQFIRVNANRYDVNPAEAYFVYSSRVQACNDLGCSGWTAYRDAQPSRPVNVSVSKGTPTTVGCPAGQSCNWLRVDATGLIPPGPFFSGQYTITCFWQTSSGAFTEGASGVVTTDANGNISNNACSFSVVGRQIYATVRATSGGWGPYESNRLTWY